MNKGHGGFTLIEILVVLTIIATLAGMVSLLVVNAQRKRIQMECTRNVQQLVGLLESGERYPAASGANLILYLVHKGAVQGRDELEVLFCPGDERETLRDAGGEAAYKDVDLDRQEYGHLTSYAGRDQSRPEIRARKGARSVVLIADDSQDHHFDQGIVVGLSGGVAKWRDKVDDYEIRSDAELLVGPGSSQPELACLRAD